MKKWCFAALLVSTIGGSAFAQQPPPPDAGAVGPAVSPAELQRMFDAYALMQAQELLKIGDEKYPQFLARFKALQDTRRRALMLRTRLIAELQRLGRDPQSDDGAIRERLAELRDLERRSTDEVRQAYDAIDQMLDVRQQAQFRAFEEQMERRKLDLISRARQTARPNARPDNPNRPNARPR